MIAQNGIAQIERRLKVEGYTCEIYSHGDVYGYVAYIERDGVDDVFLFDFGYDSLSEAECRVLANVLRSMYPVDIEDFPVLHLNDDSNCNYCPC